MRLSNQPVVSLAEVAECRLPRSGWDGPEWGEPCTYVCDALQLSSFLAGHSCLQPTGHLQQAETCQPPGTCYGKTGVHWCTYAFWGTVRQIFERCVHSSTVWSQPVLECTHLSTAQSFRRDSHVAALKARSPTRLTLLQLSHKLPNTSCWFLIHNHLSVQMSPFQAFNQTIMGHCPARPALVHHYHPASTNPWSISAIMLFSSLSEWPNS